MGKAQSFSLIKTNSLQPFRFPPSSFRKVFIHAFPFYNLTILTVQPPLEEPREDLAFLRSNLQVSSLHVYLFFTHLHGPGLAFWVVSTHIIN